MAPPRRPYCGVVRGVPIKTEAGRITGVRGGPNHPANFGRLCTNGATLRLSTTKQNRLLYPEVGLEKVQEHQRTP